jgi:NADH-quinone oxidoreductase subunit M
MSYLFSLLLILVPLFSGLAVISGGASVARPIALGSSLVTFGLFLGILNAFEATAAWQFTYEQPWIDFLNIYFKIGIDGINIIPLLLTTMLVPIILLTTRTADYKKPATLFGLILLMQAGLATVFLARTAFLFYLGWEAALIPIFFISGMFGGEQRVQITLKFFIYTVAGSLFMLLALVYLYAQTSSLSRDDFENIVAVGRSLDAQTQCWIFWGLFIAFAIKMPLFPFHTWQPDTYTNAPAPGSMLLSGIMLKMGIYGVLRWLLPVVPLGVEQNKELVLVLAVIGIVYGSIIALKQSDIKRIVAYSSFAHVGLMAAAIFSLTQAGITGSILQMLSHGVTVVGLFFVVNHVEQSVGRREVGSLGGLTKDSPSFTVYFMILLLGSVALPLTSGFIGEFLMLLGVAQYNMTLAIFAGATVILSAVYMLRMFQTVLLGPKVDETSKLRSLNLGENIALITLAILVFWIGVYPQPFLALIEPSVGQLLHMAGK